MAEAQTSRVYDLWSRFYDSTFGRLVHKRQVRALQSLDPQPGQWVLDLGIGTGITLGEYPPHVHVVGMDLSAGMLSKAQEKAAELGRDHTHLIQGDALHPPFADEAFDHLLVTHTVSVVSDPPRLMRWCYRLVKPGGRVVVLNHFQSERWPIAQLEKAVNPICCRIGWRSDLSLADCITGSGLTVVEDFKLNPADVWRIVVLRRP
jgi:phosphatidylethanolamine/phosphatidyl-N-methylethanolamine N-methyltransferase